MARSKIRIGLIGYGNWGKRIYETLCTFPNVDVLIIEKNAPASYCDAVIIATPSSTHAELALSYLEKKIPTFVEKPLATSTRDVLRIIDCVNANNSMLFVGYIYLYNNFLDIIKDYLQRLGSINSIEFIGFNQKPRIDSSLFWDWLPHDLSIFNKLFGGMPTLIETEGQISNKKIVNANVKFAFEGMYIISYLSSQKAAERTLTVHGNTGKIQFDDRKKIIEIEIDGKKNTIEKNLYNPPLRVELQEFIQSVEVGTAQAFRKSKFDLELSLKITKVIEQVEDNLQS